MRVPNDLTYAVAERVSATWDRRDNPLGATRGTLLIGGVEHVHAYRPGVVDAECYVEHPDGIIPTNCPSDFFRLTGTISAYVRLTPEASRSPPACAPGASCSSSGIPRPPRPAFLSRGRRLDARHAGFAGARGRGRKILGELAIENVAIRGGDVFINASRLRIPLGGIWEGLFLDTGNAWVSRKTSTRLVLRYAAGPGIRVGARWRVAFDTASTIRRPWEDQAFHFSIGLF